VAEVLKDGSQKQRLNEAGPAAMRVPVHMWPTFELAWRCSQFDLHSWLAQTQITHLANGPFDNVSVLRETQ
jgi:hypothetical protein